MHTEVEEFSRRLSAIGASHEVVPLRQASMHALALFDVKSAFFLAPLSKDARVGRILTNYGQSWIWERQYRARLYLIDPVPQLAMERLEPVYWPDDLAGVKLTSRQKRYMGIAAQYGMERGVGIACFGPNNRSGYLAAILPPGGKAPDTLTRLRLQSIAQKSFQTYCRLVTDTSTVPTLSNRELEVLHWIGRGKSNSVIADILGISASSIDVYVRRIFGKLGVADRTTASVRAVSLGLIISGDYERFVNETDDTQSAADGGPDEAGPDGNGPDQTG